MLFAVTAILLGLLAGLVRGGSIRSIGWGHFRAPVALGLAVLAMLGTVASASLGIELRMFALAALGWFASHNLRLAGMGVVLIGVAVTAIPVFANGAVIVDAGALADQGIELSPGETIELEQGRRIASEDDRFVELGQRIPMPITDDVFSFGDLIVLVGIADVVFNLCRHRTVGEPRRPRRRSQSAADLVESYDERTARDGESSNPGPPENVSSPRVQTGTDVDDTGHGQPERSAPLDPLPAEALAGDDSAELAPGPGPFLSAAPAPEVLDEPEQRSTGLEPAGDPFDLPLWADVDDLVWAPGPDERGQTPDPGASGPDSDLVASVPEADADRAEREDDVIRVPDQTEVPSDDTPTEEFTLTSDGQLGDRGATDARAEALRRQLSALPNLAELTADGPVDLGADLDAPFIGASEAALPSGPDERTMVVPGESATPTPTGDAAIADPSTTEPHLPTSGMRATSTPTEPPVNSSVTEADALDPPAKLGSPPEREMVDSLRGEAAVPSEPSPPSDRRPFVTQGRSLEAGIDLTSERTAPAHATRAGRVAARARNRERYQRLLSSMDDTSSAQQDPGPQIIRPIIEKPPVIVIDATRPAHSTSAPGTGVRPPRGASREGHRRSAATSGEPVRSTPLDGTDTGNDSSRIFRVQRRTNS